MYQEQRLEEILNLLEKKRELSAQEMMTHFQVSRDTVRRDFSLLAKEGKVKRTHGGIMSTDRRNEIAPYNERLKNFTREKQHIAEEALKFIQPEATAFFDASTITLKMANMITDELTVYSHSLDNAILLSANTAVDFHLLGGKFYAKNRFYYAVNEAELLNDIAFDTVFIGAAGLENGVVSFDDQEDAHLKKMVLKRAKVKILLAESSKLEKTATYSIGALSAFDYFITDKKLAVSSLSFDTSQLEIIY